MIPKVKRVLILLAAGLLASCEPDGGFQIPRCEQAENPSSKGSDAPQARWHNLMARSPYERDHNLRGGDGTQVVRILEWSPKNDFQTVFMGVDTAGVYRSDDGGHSWTSKTEEINGYHIKGFAIDPGKPDRVYALADSHPTLPSKWTGVYVSDDNGESWKLAQFLKMTGTPRVRSLDLLQMVPGTVNSETGLEQILLAGTADGLWRSEDSGASFTRTGGDILSKAMITALEVHPLDSNVVYVGTMEWGIWRSDDGGVTFTQWSEGIEEATGENVIRTEADPTPVEVTMFGRDPETPGMVPSLSLDPRTVDRVYAVVGRQGLFKREPGQVWRRVETISTGLPDFAELQGRPHYYDVTVHPANPDRILVSLARAWGLKTPYYSEDGGKTWELRNNLVVEDRFNLGPAYAHARSVTPTTAVVGHPENEDVWLRCFAFGAAYRTEDACQSWDWSNRNYGGYRGMVLLVNPEDPNHLLINAIDKGATVSFDGGQSIHVGKVEFYAGRPDALGGIIIPDPDGDSTKATVISSVGGHSPWKEGILQISHDGGLNFKPIPGTEGVQRARLIRHQRSPNVIYAGDLVSHDTGKTWERIERSGLEQVVAVDPQNPAICYLYDGQTVYRSEDFGKNPTPLVRLPYDGSYAKSFISGSAINGAGDRLYLGHDGGLYIVDLDSGEVEFKSDEAGFTRNPDGRLDLFHVVVDQNDDSIVYAGEFNLAGGLGAGVFVSHDAGETWQSMDSEHYFGVKKTWGLNQDGYGNIWSFTDQGPFWFGDPRLPEEVTGLRVEGDSLEWEPASRAYTYMVTQTNLASGEETRHGGITGTSWRLPDDVKSGPYSFSLTATNLAGHGSTSQPVELP